MRTAILMNIKPIKMAVGNKFIFPQFGLCWWVSLLLMELVHGTEMEMNRGKSRCKSNAHVCTSLMKYPDGSEFDEGPYCQCPGCSSQWRPEDMMSLSWQHYERPDKTVQYKFCIPLLPERECEPGDLAVTMSTETGEWSPHVREARCSCPDHMYQLLGWWRHPTTKHDNRTGLWIYEYFCDKPECRETGHICAKIYIDQHASDDVAIIGYNFLCACPKGYQCPDKEDDEEFDDVRSDDRGKYVPKYCELVHKGPRR